MTINVNSVGSTPVASDTIGTGTAPAAGQEVQYTKMALGATGTATPVTTSLPVGEVRGTKTTTSLTVNWTSPEQILAANANRRDATIYNAGTATLYVGGSDLASPAGIPIPAGCSLPDTVSEDAWFGYVTAGSAVLTIIETSQGVG